MWLKYIKYACTFRHKSKWTLRVFILSQIIRACSRALSPWRSVYRRAEWRSGNEVGDPNFEFFFFTLLCFQFFSMIFGFRMIGTKEKKHTVLCLKAKMFLKYFYYYSWKVATFLFKRVGGVTVSSERRDCSKRGGVISQKKNTDRYTNSVQFNIPFYFWCWRNCALNKNHFTIIVNNSVKLTTYCLTRAFLTVLCFDSLFEGA